MPKPTLYFLRSSEQKITSDMLYYAMGLDETDKNLKDFQDLEIFTRFFGLSDKDLGLYALVDSTIVGAVWLRQLKENDKANAFIDSTIPILNIAVKPEFRDKGIGYAMLEQLLIEASAVYDGISLSVLKDSKSIKLFEKFDFEIQKDINEKHPTNNKKVLTMTKKLIKKEILRPSDGYDPRRWMD